MEAKDKYRFATLEGLVLQPCKICHGISKDKCFICGQKCPKMKDLNDKQKLQLTAWKEEVAYLRRLFLKLIALKQVSTGSEDVDAKIERVIGNWRSYIVGRPAPTKNIT
jgi:hypothetical protein